MWSWSELDWIERYAIEDSGLLRATGHCLQNLCFLQEPILKNTDGLHFVAEFWLVKYVVVSPKCKGMHTFNLYQVCLLMVSITLFGPRWFLLG